MLLLGKQHGYNLTYFDLKMKGSRHEGFFEKDEAVGHDIFAKFEVLKRIYFFVEKVFGMTFVSKLRF